MKKLATTFLVLFLCMSYANSQDNYFVKDDMVVNIGIGLGSALYTGVGYTGSIPPISVSIEKGIKDDVIDRGVIGIGGYLGYSSYKWEYMNYGWKYTNIIIGARGSFHYPLLDKLDTYAGLLLGYRILSAKDFGESTIGNLYKANTGGFVFVGYVGGRYYFTDKFAAMLELGSGITYLNLGIAIKLL